MELGPLQLKWIESLEAHPERQMKSSLGKKNSDGTYNACCLGEGGLIAGVCGWNSRGSLETLNEEYSRSNFSLIGDTYKALGLRGPYGEPKDTNSGKILANLNDKENSWPEIAKLLRENPEEYFTESK